MKINKIYPDEHAFTRRLVHIDKPPRQLHYMGSLPSGDRPVVAIVGSRKPTGYGREVTERLASDLARHGCVIVSGLALGIDSIAQAAALQADGTVIAVVTNELPDISPRTNYKLAQQIIARGGAVMSEWAKGDNHPVTRWGFLERNRLVSGLADALVITEAAERSGTLNTAAHALAQGRDIFVVPGNITSPLSAGCNQLIKQGTQPVTAASDVLDVIAPPSTAPAPQQTSLALTTNPAEQAILDLLQQGLRDGDQLQQRSGLDSATFATALTMLEINGHIAALGANQWRLC